MAKHSPPGVPFVEAYNRGTKHRPTAIILKLSDTTSEKGAALGIANYQHKPNAPLTSHHYVVDEAEIYRCIPDNIGAHSWPHRAIVVLVCAQYKEHLVDWDTSLDVRSLHLAANLVGDLILAHKIKPRYLDYLARLKWEHRRWRRNGGISVQAPGAWPYEAFMIDVESRIKLKSS
jgi:hypothetical protein